MLADFDVGAEIIEGVKDVFATMLSIDLVCEEVLVGQRVQLQSNLTSMVGLGGGIRGLLAVHCSEKIATAITGKLLGMEIAEIDDDVKDAIGEIANMVAGNLKVSFRKIDIDLALAIPTSIVGKSFYVSGIADASRVAVPLQMDEGIFWVELMYILNG